MVHFSTINRQMMPLFDAHFVQKRAIFKQFQIKSKVGLAFA